MTKRNEKDILREEALASDSLLFKILVKFNLLPDFIKGLIFLALILGGPTALVHISHQNTEKGN